MQTGLVTILPLNVIVKLVPGVLAVIANPPTKVASVLLQVTPEMVTLSSTSNLITLAAVTAVVFTVSVELPVPVGTATAPSAADPQTAGLAPFAQFVAVK
jgi:hypothetical protein